MTQNDNTQAHGSHNTQQGSTQKGKTQQGRPAHDQLTRSMESRHLTMISLGGVIGTGLFVSSGHTIHDAGPFGAVRRKKAASDRLAL